MEERTDAPDRNLVLTGFMGTGKTTVGRLVAAALDFEFVDTDAVIEQRHGPIPQLFAEHGEGHFRQLERELAAELADRSALVIATGGRLMLDAVNAERLGATGDVICLSASVDTILARVTADDGVSERPLLAADDARGRIEQLLAERVAGYARFRQIDTDARSPDAVAEEIIEAFEDAGGSGGVVDRPPPR